MFVRALHLKPMLRLSRFSLVALFPPMLAACQQETTTEAPEARPVRTITVEKREAGTPVTMTGRIEAEDEVTFAFRISGRQPHLALLIAHGEIIPATVVEIADTSDARAVTVDDRPRHHRDFRSPLTIVRGSDGNPPRDHAEKQHDQDHRNVPLPRQPESPDRERRKNYRQRQTRPSPGQVRIVDGQGRPCDEQDPQQKPDPRHRPAEKSGQETATRPQ